ncbi:trehalose transporter 1-like protein isoform X2 [Nomia melanderi]|nr:facilitated trehalose transporter Tret1-2 homolog isoform X2 [Nomia melanderi]
MLNYQNVNYAEITQVENICDDIENNNAHKKDGCNTLDDSSGLATYTSNSKGILAQCLVSGAVLLLAAGGGMPIGYSAILLPQLGEENSTIRVDRELGSWIASVHSLATPVGSLLSGPLLDGIGRRGSLQLSAIPLCTGWIIMGVSTNVPYLLTGRIVSGLAVGLMSVPAQVLLAEMSDPRLRGILTGLSLVFYCFGILLVYALGASFTWDVVAFCGIILPLMALIAFTLIPESPVWLVRQAKLKKARKALLWLRGGNTDQVNTEIAILEARVKADLARKIISTSYTDQMFSAISTILDPTILKPLIIINVFNILLLSSGTYIIVFYAVELISNIGGENINNYFAAVITAVIRLLFTLIGSTLLLFLGRRSLGILSAFGSGVASLFLAGYILTRKESSSIDVYVVGVCLLMYVAANSLGLMVLPGIMGGELLPQRARGIGGAFSFFVFNMFTFAVTKIFPMISEAVGIPGIFIIFGSSALLETAFIYVALPETKNRTLQEIEDYFQQKNLLWVTRLREKRKHKSKDYK